MWLENIDFVQVAITVAAALLAYALKHRLSWHVCIFLLAAAHAQLFAQVHLSNTLKTISSEAITVEGLVHSIPLENEHRSRFVFKAQNIQQQKILLNHYPTNQDEQLIFKPGQAWRFTVKLKPPSGLANPGGFDYEKWLFRHRIDAIGTIQSAELLQNKNIPLLTSIHAWRYDLSQWINTQFSERQTRGLVKALIIGDKSDLNKEDHEKLQQTGTAHLIAISGLHIGIMALIGHVLGTLLFNIFRLRRINLILSQSILALFFALAYTLLAGFSTPTVRALIMLSVFLFRRIALRSHYAWDSFAVALVLVLAFDPLSVLDMGFWLSFSAVFLLLYAFRGRVAPASKLLAFIRAQWVILIGLLPVSIWVFGQFKLYTPLINFILIPLMSFLLLPLLLMLLLIGSIVPEQITVLVVLIEYIVRVFYQIMGLFQQLNWLDVFIPSTDIISWSLLSLFCLLILSPKVLAYRWIGFIFLLPILFNQTSNIQSGAFEVKVIDVGQGLSVLITTKQHALLFDTGSRSPGGFNMADAAIIPVLKKYAIKQIDTVVLSHADNDHAGSYEVLEQAFTIHQTMSTFGDYKPCIAQNKWSWDGVDFQILSPYNTTPYLANNSSCVIRISNAHHSILLTGDIEEAVEYRLLTHAKDEIPSDILMVPHHGSNTSSSQAFIEAVKPFLAINSSAYNNPFRHPSELVKNRYSQNGIQFLDTQEHGMISISMDQQLRVASFRLTYPRIWRR